MFDTCTYLKWILSHLTASLTILFWFLSFSDTSQFSSGYNLTASTTTAFISCKYHMTFNASILMSHDMSPIHRQLLYTKCQLRKYSTSITNFVSFRRSYQNCFVTNDNSHRKPVFFRKHHTSPSGDYNIPGEVNERQKNRIRAKIIKLFITIATSKKTQYKNLVR